MIEIITLFFTKAVNFFGEFYLLLQIKRVKSPSGAYIRSLQKFIIGSLICGALVDLLWLISLAQKNIPHLQDLIYFKVFCNRISWALLPTEYLLLAIFIEKLSSKKFTYKKHHFMLGLIDSLLSLYPLFIAFFYYFDIEKANRSLEFYVYGAIMFYLFLALVPSLYIAIRNSMRSETPRILQKQVQTLIYYFFIPHLLFLALSCNPWTLVSLRAVGVNQYQFIIFNDLFFIFALYFCVQRILSLRFLNIRKQVQSSHKYTFIDDFKELLIRLSHVSSFTDLEKIAQTFFQTSFQVPPEAVQLHVHPQTTLDVDQEFTTSTQIPHYLDELIHNAEHRPLLGQIEHARILIRDELDFDYFYEEGESQQRLIKLLHAIDADIFIPIYERKTMIGSLIIRRDSRKKMLFGNGERDEMCIFASYLGAIIYLMQHRNLAQLVKQEKAMEEDLYLKQQELNHYKESVRNILKTSAQRAIGVIYYQKRKIIWLNETIRTMLGVKSLHEDHSLYSSVFKQLAQEVIKYRTERSLMLKDATGRSIQCLATPYEASSHVLILVYYTDIADTLTIPFDMLRDVASWEYALYLETTTSGKLINQLIPSSSEAMLNFKIDLLKIALSKKAPLLELPDEDLAAVVNIIHHVSLKSKLHTINLQKSERNSEIGIQLFGIEPLISTDTQEGLLSALRDTGTIFIKNVEFLSLETQNRLATYLNTGMFQLLNSNRYLRSNVRIICSTSTNLEFLIEQQKFSSELFQKLRTTAIVLPSLLTLPRHELAHLAHQVTEQTIESSEELRPFIRLDSQETEEILHQGPTSLYELKQQIKHAIKVKSTKQQMQHIVHLESSSPDLHPDINKAIRLGKRALKDKQLMTLLWKTFQSQAQIATLLNVNRSSVNRRCKEFNLPTEKVLS